MPDDLESSGGPERRSYSLAGERPGDAALPPPPEIPPNVTEVGLPDRSESVAIRGKLLDYLPVAEFCDQGKCAWTRELKSGPWLGILSPSGENVGKKYRVDGAQGELLCVWMFRLDSQLKTGTVVGQELYWQRLSQSLVPAGEDHETTVAITSGITVTRGRSLSRSVGARVGIGEALLGELSGSLTESFSQQVSITEQTTVTETFRFSPEPVEQVVGVYRLVRSFEILPGPNYAAYVAAVNRQGAQGPVHFRVAAKLPFSYPAPSYLQVAGVNDANAVVERRMLSDEEMHELVAELGPRTSSEG